MLTEDGPKGSSEIGVDEILLALLARCYQAGWYPRWDLIVIAFNLYLTDNEQAGGLFHLQRLDHNIPRRQNQLLVELTSLRVRAWVCWDRKYLYPQITREGLQRAATIQLPPDIEQLARVMIEKITESRK